MAGQDPWRERGKALRASSKGLAIPSLMLGGPLGGGLAGYAVGSAFERPQQGIVVGILAGLLIAGIQIVRLLVEMARDEDRRSEQRRRKKTPK